MEGENEELKAKLHCTVQCLQGASSELLTVQLDHSTTSELKAKLHCTIQCLQGVSSELLTVQLDHSTTSELLHDQEGNSNALKEENSTLRKRLNFYTKGTCK